MGSFFSSSNSKISSQSSTNSKNIYSQSSTNSKNICSQSSSNSSGSNIKEKSKYNLKNVFSNMGNFSNNFYQINSQEIKDKHSQNGNESWKNFIKKKIESSEEAKQYAQNFAEHYNISVEELAYMLGDEELYKKYLLIPLYNPLKIIESINNELGDLYQERNELTEDEIKEQINNINKRKKEFLNSNVKFILTDIGINEYGRLGNLLTSIWNFFNKDFPYGALHAGLMINETIIQWGKGPLGAEIIFPSTDLRNILFSIEIESTKKKKKKTNYFMFLGLLQ